MTDDDNFRPNPPPLHCDTWMVYKGARIGWEGKFEIVTNRYACQWCETTAELTYRSPA